MIADDRLDVERLMADPNGELLCVGPQLFVLLQRQRDALSADGVPALADDLELWQDVAEALRDTLEALVDVAEEDLVLDDAFLVLFDGCSSPAGGSRREPSNNCRTLPWVSRCCILRMCSPTLAASARPDA